MSDYAAEIGVLFKPDMSLVDRAVMESASKWGRATANLGKNFPLGKLAGDASEFHKSMDAANARVLAFGASAGSIFVVKSAFDKLLSSTIDVEKQLTDINAVLNLGATDLRQFSSQLFSIANATSTMFSDATKVATEFSRQGLSVEETLKRTSSALTLSRLAGIGFEDAVSSLTATINSFTKEALSTEDIVNRLTSVDAKYAVSANDLAKALSRVGSTASDANVTFNQTIGLITAAQQITARGGSVIGNSFKSIFTRLQRPAVLDDLASAGIHVRDLQGKLLPMVSILRNLAGAYDTLSSAQKSFVSETVGGVYQINILKAVLGDVKSGTSVFEGAMDAAADSAGTAQKRIDTLGSTMAASLVRTQNELTRLAANIGNISIAPGLKSGIGGFNSLVGMAANAMDSKNADSGSVGQQMSANLFQGIVRGIGNILEGPGIQFITTIFAKLMGRLAQFISDSAKDLLGVNQKEQEREAINANIAKWLGTQEGILEKIASGEMSINEATKERQKNLEIILRTYQNIATVSSSLTPSGNPTISLGGTTHGQGFIPNVVGEIAAASQGGYTAGRVVGTTIRDGGRAFNATVNMAETKSSIAVGGTGRVADFINPPLNTPAGQRHRVNSMKRLGIDPYSLPQKPVNAASGLIPNLTLEDMQARLKAIGIADWRKLQKPFATQYNKGQDKHYPLVPDFDLSMLPDDFVAAATKHFTSPDDIAALLRFSQKQIYDKKLALQKSSGEKVAASTAADVLKSTFWTNSETADSNEGLWGALRGSLANADTYGLLPTLRKEKGIHKDNLANFIGSIIGKGFEAPTSDKDEAVHMDVATAQALLARYSSSFPSIAAYDSIHNLQVPKDEPDFRGKIRVGGTAFDFNAPVYGHKTFLSKHLSEAQMLTSMSSEFEGDGSYTTGDLARQIGAMFESRTRKAAIKAGHPLGSNNALLDIPADFKALVAETNIKGGVSGIELKSSMQQAKEHAASKIFRSLVGDTSDSDWSGPLETPNKLAGVPKFVSGKSTGIIDYNQFGSSSRNEMLLAAVKAAAQGKAIKIIHGAGQFATAQAAAVSTQIAGGKNYVKTTDDIANYEQLVVNSFVRQPAGLKKGYSGLLYSLASEVHGLPLPENLNEKQLNEYQSLREMMKGRLGERYTGAANGLIPSSLGEGHFNQIVEFLSKHKLKADAIKLSSNDYTDAISYLNNTPQYLNDDLKNGGFGGAFPFGRKKTSGVAELLKRKSFRFYGSGFIPAIEEALEAENKATNGHAVLSKSAKLVTPANPMGWAAIDGRSQRNADEAVAQHMAFGQSLGKIKKMRSNAVPNLAVSDDSGFGSFASSSVFTSLALSMGSLINQRLGSTVVDSFKMSAGILPKSLSATINPEFEALAKEIAKLDNTIGNARSEVLSDKKTTTFGGVPNITSLNQLEDVYSTQRKNLSSPSYESYQKHKEDTKSQLQSFGWSNAMKAGLAGGVATQVAGRFSPRAGEAVEEFTAGLTQSYQVLAAFPNAFGKALRYGVLAGAATSALDIFVKGLANSQKAFEISQSRFQKLAVQIDGLSNVMNNFDVLVNDSTVSLETIVRESRKYSEIVGQLSQTKEGRDVVGQVVGAPDSRTAIAAMQSYKVAESRKLDRQASTLNLDEYTAKKTFGSGMFTVGNALSYSNAGEKNSLQQMILDAGKTGIDSLDSDKKKGALDSTKGGFEEFSEFLKTANPELKEFINGLKGPMKGAVTKEMFNQLSSERAFSDPENQQKLKGLRERNASRQLDLDSSIRNNVATKRLFVNQGSMLADNILDRKNIESRKTYDSAQLRYAEGQADNGYFGLKTGERTMQKRQTLMEVARLQSEGSFKAQAIKNTATRAVTGALTQNFDSYLGHTDMTKYLTAAGQSNVGNVEEFKANLIQSANRGITQTVQTGNLDRFTKNGAFDSKAFIAEVSKNSGSSSTEEGVKTQKAVMDFLQNNSSIEILKTMQNASLELVNLSQDQKLELQKIAAADAAMTKQMDFKQLSAFMGGTKNLSDRSFRRSQERDITRSAYLLNHGTTAEARGQGGLGVLKFFKDMNVPIDLKGKSPMSQMMVKAWTAAQQGLSVTMGQSLGRIMGSENRLNGGKTGIGAYLNNVDIQKAAGASMLADFKPENSAITGENPKGNAMGETMKQFDTNLSSATSSVFNFGNSLQTTAQMVLQAEQDLMAKRKSVSEAGNQDTKNITDAIKSGFESAKENYMPEKESSNWAGTLKTLAPTALMTGALLLGNKDVRGGIGSMGKKAWSIGQTDVGASVANAGRKVGSFFDSKPSMSGYAGKKSLGGTITTSEYNKIIRGETPTSFDKGTKSGFNPNRGIFHPSDSNGMDYARGKQQVYDTLGGKYSKPAYGGNPWTEFKKTSMPQPSVALEVLPAKTKTELRAERRAGYSAEERRRRQVYLDNFNPNVVGEQRPMKYVTNQSQDLSFKKSPTKMRISGKALSNFGSQAVGFASNVGRNMTGVGSMIVSNAMLMAGANMEGVGGQAMMMGSMVAPQLLGGAAKATGTLLGAGGFGLGSGAALKLGSMGMGATMGTVALGAGAAYGGFKAGQFLDRHVGYSRFSGVVDAEKDLESSSIRSNSSTAQVVKKMISSGKSQKDIDSFINTQINTTEGQLKTVRGGFLTKTLGTSATGVGNIEKTLQNTVAELTQLKEDSALAKVAHDQNDKENDAQNRLIAALDKLAGNQNKGGSENSKVDSNITVEISLKDADKMPDIIFQKLIMPLQKQLSELQNQTNILSNQVAPKPAKV